MRVYALASGFFQEEQVWRLPILLAVHYYSICIQIHSIKASLKKSFFVGPCWVSSKASFHAIPRYKRTEPHTKRDFPRFFGIVVVFSTDVFIVTDSVLLLKSTSFVRFPFLKLSSAIVGEVCSFLFSAPLFCARKGGAYMYVYVFLYCNRFVYSSSCSSVPLMVPAIPGATVSVTRLGGYSTAFGVFVCLSGTNAVHIKPFLHLPCFQGSPMLFCCDYVFILLFCFTFSP